MYWCGNNKHCNSTESDRNGTESRYTEGPIHLVETCSSRRTDVPVIQSFSFSCSPPVEGVPLFLKVCSCFHTCMGVCESSGFIFRNEERWIGRERGTCMHVCMYVYNEFSCNHIMLPNVSFATRYTSQDERACLLRIRVNGTRPSSLTPPVHTPIRTRRSTPRLHVRVHMLGTECLRET